MLKTIRGMRDICDEELAKFRYLEKKAAEIFPLYDFKEIRTPIVEFTDLFLRGVGEETDIVSKEMYIFNDRKEQSLTLRPEGTAPIVRHAVINNLHKSEKTTKLYYSGPMFRFERPQKGRYRQFHQLGAEFFGVKTIYADFEIIQMLDHYLKEAGLTKRSFEVNWIGSFQEREQFKKILKQALTAKKNELCGLCENRLNTNPMRIFDCKNPNCAELIKDIPTITEHISNEGKDSFKNLIELLRKSDIDFNINSRLVRGLDYYSDFVFEIYSEHFGAQSAIGGGGRYDGLFEIYETENTGAVGFALGMDRMAILLNREEEKRQGFFVLGQNIELNMEICGKLRQAGYKAEIDFSSGSFKSQFKQADKFGAEKVLILGEDEIRSETLSVKDMYSGEQVKLSLSDFFENLKPPQFKST